MGCVRPFQVEVLYRQALPSSRVQYTSGTYLRVMYAGAGHSDAQTAVSNLQRSQHVTLILRGPHRLAHQAYTIATQDGRKHEVLQFGVCREDILRSFP